MTADYRRQIAVPVDIGADLPAAETLLHPLEAISILTSAARKHAHTVMISFACKPDGTLYSGHTTEDCICLSTEADASAVGIISEAQRRKTCSRHAPQNTSKSFETNSNNSKPICPRVHEKTLTDFSAKVLFLCD